MVNFQFDEFFALLHPQPFVLSNFVLSFKRLLFRKRFCLYNLFPLFFLHVLHFNHWFGQVLLVPYPEILCWVHFWLHKAFLRLLLKFSLLLLLLQSSQILLVVLTHPFLNFQRLLPGLLDLLVCSRLLLLQHPNSVLKLQHVFLNFEADWAGLGVGQVFRLQINN